MGNSTIQLQSVVDFALSIPDLAPIFEQAGAAVEPALTIANDVMRDLLAVRFNWKWNRLRVASFYTNSWQQDYPQVGLANLGWLEHAYIVDINNTALPKPIFWLRTVKQLERTSRVESKPGLICWLPNDQLDEVAQDAWPGAAVTIANPLGLAAQPANPKLAFIDGNGNILVLTQFGITGLVAPAAAANAADGVQVNDGTCKWTVAGAKNRGFRIAAIPAQTGVLWQVNVIAQMRPPVFANLQQVLDPIPDDFAGYFRTGFVAKTYGHSIVPAVRAKQMQMELDWMKSLKQAIGQEDREPDSFGIVPVRGIMDNDYPVDPGPAWPYGPVGR